MLHAEVNLPTSSPTLLVEHDQCSLAAAVCEIAEKLLEPRYELSLPQRLDSATKAERLPDSIRMSVLPTVRNVSPVACPLYNVSMAAKSRLRSSSSPSACRAEGVCSKLRP